MTPYDDPSLSEFAGYLTAKEPGRRERADAWATAIGLQQVDGLKPSSHLYEVAKRHIEGEISASKARDLVDEYYETKTGRELPEDLKEADIWKIHPFREGNTRTTAVFAIKYLKELGYPVQNNMFKDNSWYFRNALVRASYENAAKSVAKTFEPLERFFQNLLLGTSHELKSRYLLVGLTNIQRKRLKGLSEKGGQKKVVRKGGQKTADRLLTLLKAQPHLTRDGLSAALGICPSAVQKHIAHLKAAGRLRRIGPDKGGHWEIAK